VAEELERLMEAGLKVQVAPAGRPEQDIATRPLKPFTAERDSVSLALCPRVTLSEAAGAWKLKSDFPTSAGEGVMDPKRPSFSWLIPAEK